MDKEIFNCDDKVQLLLFLTVMRMVLWKTLTLASFDATLKSPGPPVKLGIDLLQVQTPRPSTHIWRPLRSRSSIVPVVPSQAAASKKSSMTTLATVAPSSPGERRWL